jgi:MFS transporter, OFA family, oxalate/formate antiporter
MYYATMLTAHTRWTQTSRKPFLIAGAAVSIQTLLGSLYAWSVFVPALKELGGLTATQTQTIFGVMIAVFTLTMVVAGRLLDNVGPRRVAVVGGMLYGGGYLAASFSGGAFLPLLLSIGVVAGMGIGCGYVCALACCLRWFPQRKGFITGLAVAGFGAGAVGLSAIAGTFLNAGVAVLQIFWWMGILFGIGIVLAALLLSFPATAKGGEASDCPAPPARIWRSPVFWTASGGIFAGTFAGLLIIGNLKPIALAAGLELPVAIAAISAFAVGNTLGRLFWGCLYDRLGFYMLPLSLALLGTLILLLAPAGTSKLLFLPTAAAVGAGFGACFVLYAAVIATHFGPARVGLIYPWVFLFYGAAALLGPAAGGWLYDFSGSFTWSILLAGAVSWSAAGMLLLMRRTRSPARSMSPASA